MKIKDKSAFLPHTSILKIKLISGKTHIYSISLNTNVDTYYTVICNLAFFEEKQNANYIIDTATKILQSADKRVTRNWVINNIDIKVQMGIIEKFVDEINKLLNADYLQIPDIDVEEKAVASKYEKERADKKSAIKNLRYLLSKKEESNLIEGITLVMMKTGNTYSEIMQMPILFFRNLEKQIILNELCVDDDYNIAYLKSELEKYKDELNSGKAVISTSAKGAKKKESIQFF